MPHIVVADADPIMYSQVQSALAGDGYRLTNARTPIAALQAIQRLQPELLIMGTLMPMGSSIDLCRQLRAAPATSRLTILFLTDYDTAQAVVDVLDSGGDDHVRLPFVGRELSARVRALMRRQNPRRGLSLVFGSDGQSVTVADKQVTITPTEYDLLFVLSQSNGKHLSAAHLLQAVWHYPAGTGDTALVRNHIRNLRIKLEDDPDHPRILVSHHGRGYALAVDSVRRSDGTRMLVTTS